MGNTWVTDMKHYLDEDGYLAEMPGPALKLALFQGAIVSWVTAQLPRQIPRTNVTCRRTPGRQRCLGEIHAFLEVPSERIIWHCPFCGDNGLISGWEGTEWDRRVPAG